MNRQNKDLNEIIETQIQEEKQHIKITTSPKKETKESLYLTLFKIVILLIFIYTIFL